MITSMREHKGTSISADVEQSHRQITAFRAPTPAGPVPVLLGYGRDGRVCSGLDRFRGGGEERHCPADGWGVVSQFADRGRARVHQQRRPTIWLEKARVILSGGPDAFSKWASRAARRLEMVQLTSEMTCQVATDGGAGVGLDRGGILIRGGAHIASRFPPPAGGRSFARPRRPSATPIHSSSAWALRDYRPAAWKRDLCRRMPAAPSGASTSHARRTSGGWSRFSLWDRSRGHGEVLVSESWRHQLFRSRREAIPRRLFDDLPGYPPA